MPVDASIFGRGKTYQDYEQAKQEFDARNALAMAQTKKAMTPDLDELGQKAYLKMANGIPLDPSEQAALSYIDQKSQTFGFNPATGRLEQKPSLLQRINGTNQQPNISPQAMPSPNINPQGPFAKAMDGAPQAGTGDPLADMGVTSPIPNTINNISPKSEQLLSDENIKSGRKRVDELVTAAANAGAANRAAQTMLQLQPEIGYTGFGGGLVAGADRALSGLGMPNVIKGDVGARETFQTLGVDSWVKAVEPLKGALTEQEGARFDKAVSNFGTSAEGIKKRAALTEALANRAAEKSQFYERYFAKNGTLTGADAIFDEYSNKNPIVTDDMLKPVKKGMTKEQFNNQQKLTPAEQEELNQLRARFQK